MNRVKWRERVCVCADEWERVVCKTKRTIE